MSELQTAITNLQLKHSELTAAVKSYPGTVASAANAAFGNASVEQRKARDTVRNLRKRIENDGQSLILDWEHDVAVVKGEGRNLSEVVTFSRSTGGGRFGPDGKYEWVEANVPRIDYDSETGECRGLLVEEQRTNLATGPYSGFHTGNGTGVTFEPVPPFLSDPGVTPDAVRVSTTGAGATRFQYIGGSQAVGELLTMSWYERYVDFTPAVGTSALTLSSQVGLEIQTPLTLQEVKPGIFRATVTLVTTLVGEVIFRAYFSKFVDVLDAVEFWAFQIERGSFPTSYIPTNGVAVTRAEDRVSLASVEPWFNRSEGTFLAEVNAVSTVDRTRLILNKGGGARFFYRTTNPELVYSFDGTTIANSNSMHSGGGLPHKMATRYDATSFVTGIHGGMGTPRNGGQSLREVQDLSILTTESGHIKRLEYFPRALSDSEFQELTL